MMGKSHVCLITERTKGWGEGNVFSLCNTEERGRGHIPDQIPSLLLPLPSLLLGHTEVHSLPSPSSPSQNRDIIPPLLPPPSPLPLARTGVPSSRPSLSLPPRLGQDGSWVSRCSIVYQSPIINGILLKITGLPPLTLGP